MKIMKKSWKRSLILALVLMWSFCLPVLAASDDNSLAALNVHNGTVTPDFAYNIWEYDVTVEPGTTELLLEPVTSDANASITSITGTVLEDGKATVMVNTISESGNPMTYTLHVTESGQKSEEATEAIKETEQSTEKATEAQTETAPQTEVQTEAQTEAAATNALQDQVSKLKSNSDLMMKIMYGLIALAVILLFFIINLILKNRDLKDDLKDAEDQLAYQTNEFARKERTLATDNYYAPTQQGVTPQPVAPAQKEEPIPAYTPVQQTAPAVEETFGTRASAGGYQGMQPEDVPASQPITAKPAPTPVPEQRPQAVPGQAPAAQPAPQDPQMEAAPMPGADPEKKDVDITMVEL